MKECPSTPLRSFPLISAPSGWSVTNAVKHGVIRSTMTVTFHGGGTIQVGNWMPSAPAGDHFGITRRGPSLASSCNLRAKELTGSRQ